MRPLALALAVLAAACMPAAHPQAPVQSTTSRVVGKGTADDPVVRCGPGDSYHYVQYLHHCRNGATPTSWQRAGSQGSPRNSDVLDVYKVSCPEGDSTVLIDMYGCEEPRARGRGLSERIDRAVEMMEQGNFMAAEGQCSLLMNSDAPTTKADLIQCLMIRIAIASLTQQEEQAAALTSRVCAALPTASEAGDPRIGFVSEALRWTIRAQGASQLTRSGFDALRGKLSAACGLAASAVNPTHPDPLMSGP